MLKYQRCVAKIKLLPYLIPAAFSQIMRANPNLYGCLRMNTAHAPTYFTLAGYSPEKIDLSANILRAGVNYKF